MPGLEVTMTRGRYLRPDRARPSAVVLLAMEGHGGYGLPRPWIINFVIYAKSLTFTFGLYYSIILNIQLLFGIFWFNSIFALYTFS
jgi:hypothetical protein